MDRPNFSLKRLAKALNEPVGILRTTAMQPFYPWPATIWSVEQNGRQATGLLRFCPECVQMGYHAVFHQLPWFAQCMVHGTMLQQVHIKGAGNPSMGAQPRGDPTSLIETLLSLRTDGTFKVRLTAETNARGLANMDWQLAETFLAWVRKAHLPEKGGQCRRFYCDFGSNFPNSGARVAQYLHFLHREIAAPAKAMAALRPDRLVGEISVSKYVIHEPDRPAIASIFTVQPEFLLRTLLELRLMQCLLTDEKPQWHALAMLAVQSMQNAWLPEESQGMSGKLLDDSEDYSGGFRIRPVRGVRREQALLQQFVRHWNCSMDDEDYQATQLMKAHAAHYMASMGSLVKTGLIESFPTHVFLTGFLRHVREVELTCWAPISPLLEVCDAVLDAIVNASVWLIWSKASDGTAQTETLDFWSHAMQPCVSLELKNQRTLVLKIGRRTPSTMPNWSSQRGASHGIPIGQHDVDQPLNVAIGGAACG